MQNIDLLELGVGGPFAVRVDDQDIVLPDPADLHFQAVLLALRERHVPGTPSMANWKRALVFERWSAHYDLPDFESARRLAYLVDHHRSAIVYDLQTFCSGADLGELWRARRWRTLLDYIDHLPSHSWFSAAVAMDEEHAQMLAESLAARHAEGEADAAPSGPSLTSWTPEVSYLARVEDICRYIAWATFAAQIGKQAGEPPKPGPVPVTPLQRAMKRVEHERRKAAHEALVARVLPNKRPPSDAVD